MNRRVPNGTHGGVRGRKSPLETFSYSMGGHIFDQVPGAETDGRPGVCALICRARENSASHRARRQIDECQNGEFFCFPRGAASAAGDDAAPGISGSSVIS